MTSNEQLILDQQAARLSLDAFRATADNPFWYTFVTPDGSGTLRHSDYLKEPYLVNLVHDAIYPTVRTQVRILFVGRTVYLWPIDILEQKQQIKAAIDEVEADYRLNRFKYYAPVSQSYLDFLNDTSHNALIICGPNRCGKTTQATIRLFLGSKYSAFPMDKSWPIFSEFGVKWRPFNEPLSLAMATSSEKNLKETVWPKMSKFWTPQTELGTYCTATRSQKRRVEPAWGHDASNILNCETRISYYTYMQGIQPYQSAVHNGILWDEQPHEFQFNELDERTRTVAGEHLFSFTPVTEQGRSDTGAGSWLQKMATGISVKGKRVKVYTTPVHFMPDWLYPEHEKITAIVKHEISAKREGNNIAISEGRARLFGEFHYKANIIFSEWQPEFSWIDPIWTGHPDPSYTLYRSCDHGSNNPSVCLWFAVDREMNVILYREYYKLNPLIGSTVQDIVRMSGNSLMLSRDQVKGDYIKRYEEVMESEGFAKTVMDSRSMAKKEDYTGKTYGQIYRMSGLQIQPASGKEGKDWIPIVNELMRIDPTRKHLVSGKFGAPKLYVFNTCVNFKREVEGYVYETVNDEKSNQSDRPRKKDDHGCSCIGYACQIPMRWQGNSFSVSSPVDTRGPQRHRQIVSGNSLGYRGIG